MCMYTHMDAGLIVRYWRQLTEDTPGHTRLSAASSPRGCWVSVYVAGYISAGPCLAMYMYNVCCNCMNIIAVARAENYR